MVFFTNSGTEANELAMMIARLYTGYNDIISLRNGYHGNAAGTMGATAQSIWKFNITQVHSHPSACLVCHSSENENMFERDKIFVVQLHDSIRCN